MANGLAAAFIANNSTNDVLVCYTLNGQAWFSNTNIGETSNGTAPSLAVFNGSLWAAFVANNSTRTVLVCSSSDGVHWSGNTSIGETSQSAPSLAVFNGKLWAAFIANNSTNTVLVCSSSDGVHWSGNTSIGATSQSAPSLAVFNGSLWAAFVANNSTRTVLVCSSSDGVHWSGNTSIGETSQSAPSLAVFNGKLWAAFIANNSTNTVLVCSSSDGVHWSANTGFGETSNGTAPSLTVFNGSLWVAFIADNSTKTVLVCSSSDGVHWSNNAGIGETSQSSPSLAAFGNLPPAINLSVPWQAQQQGNWCWAATSSMISHFYNPSSTWTQCAIATGTVNEWRQAHGQASVNCCTPSEASSPDCNVTWGLQPPLQLVGNFGSGANGGESAANVYDQLRSGNPVCIQILWSGGGGHFLIIDGIDMGTQTVHVEDPAYGPGDYAYTTVATDYQGSGTWSDTFLTVS